LKKREVIFVVVALILGAVFGGLVGDILGSYLPPSAAQTLFTKSIDIGFETIKVDFYAIAFTIGFMLKINFMSVLFVILVIIYFKWWYL
jgi:uncharacterized membrane protein YeiH